MMIVFKGFNKDLTCRGYQFHSDKINITDKANCVANGFHAAENPLDCLSYYTNMDKSVYWICTALGDIDEDGNDSKISCTELALMKELTLGEFVRESLKYMQAHPLRPWNSRVYEEKAIATDHFAIARGKNPKAKGELGTIIGLAKEVSGSSNILATALFEVDGEKIKPNVWYDLFGKVIESEDDK